MIQSVMPPAINNPALRGQWDSCFCGSSDGSSKKKKIKPIGTGGGGGRKEDLRAGKIFRLAVGPPPVLVEETGCIEGHGCYGNEPVSHTYTRQAQRPSSPGLPKLEFLVCQTVSQRRRVTTVRCVPIIAVQRLCQKSSRGETGRKLFCTSLAKKWAIADSHTFFYL
jgi:hypothetical protein